MPQSKEVVSLSRWRSLAGVSSSCLLLCMALSQCIVGHDKCDENQELAKGSLNVCRCVAGTVPDPRGYGCIRCGEHEQPLSDVCACAVGFERKTRTAPCEVSTGGALGAPCDETLACAEPYSYCASSGGEHYCTRRGCTAPDECPAMWRCQTSDAESFCAKPPLGLGTDCMHSDDCAATEATYCDSFFTNRCYVEKCATGENVCPSSYVCCDLARLVGTSVCAPFMMLQNGICPDGQAPVSP